MTSTDHFALKSHGGGRGNVMGHVGLTFSLGVSANTNHLVAGRECSRNGSKGEGWLGSTRVVECAESDRGQDVNTWVGHGIARRS